MKLGDYAWQSVDGQFAGTSVNGISWIATKLVVDPNHLGFHEQWVDQMHHGRFAIPKSRGIFADGKITIRMVASLSQDRDEESAGWDNINVAYESKCTDPPTPVPTSVPASHSFSS